jgi:hypothetical protein
MSRRYRMLRFSVFVIFIFLFFNIYAERIVVWNLKPQTGVTEKETVTVTSILTSEIERISKKKVVSEAEIGSVIDGETIRIACGVDDNACIAEIGAAMGAPFSVSGILSKMGDYWVITLQLVDIKKVETASRVNKRFKGDMNSLIESLTPLVYKLFGEELPATVEPEKKQPEPEKKQKVKKERKPVSWQKATGWTFTTVGVLALGGGIFANIMMNSARDGFRETGNSSDEKMFETMRGLSIGGYVAGSVLIATGITLIVVDAVNTRKEKRKNTVFYIFPYKDGFAGGIEWRW